MALFFARDEWHDFFLPDDDDDDDRIKVSQAKI